MRILVISLVALSIAIIAKADKPEDYPPPPPVPKSAKLTTTTTTPSTTKKPIITTLRRKVPPPSPPQVKNLKPKLRPKKKSSLKKPPLVKKRPPPPPPKIVKKEAQRRDSTYGAPAAPAYQAPKRQVIIKQAGPSKQYGWVGHGRYAPLGIKNPFIGQVSHRHLISKIR